MDSRLRGNDSKRASLKLNKKGRKYENKKYL